MDDLDRPDSPRPQSYEPNDSSVVEDSQVERRRRHKSLFLVAVVAVGLLGFGFVGRELLLGACTDSGEYEVVAKLPVLQSLPANTSLVEEHAQKCQRNIGFSRDPDPGVTRRYASMATQDEVRQFYADRLSAEDGWRQDDGVSSATHLAFYNERLCSNIELDYQWRDMDSKDRHDYAPYSELATLLQSRNVATAYDVHASAASPCPSAGRTQVKQRIQIGPVTVRL